MKLLLSLATLAVLGAGPLLAQVTSWSIGEDSGNSWQDFTEVSVLMDNGAFTAALGSGMPEGALQPMELHPDVNIIPIIYWEHPINEYQDPISPHYVNGEPRFWRAWGNYGHDIHLREVDSPANPSERKGMVYTVDGNRGTYAAFKDYGPGGSKMTTEFYTWGFGGPIPLERFMIWETSDPPADPQGKPYSEYIPRQGELSGGGIGTEERMAEEQRISLAGGDAYELLEYERLTQFSTSFENNFTHPIDLTFTPQYVTHIRWRTNPDRYHAGDEGGGYASFIVDHYALGEFEMYGNGFAATSFLQTTSIPVLTDRSGNPEAGILGKVTFGISKWRREEGAWDPPVLAGEEYPAGEVTENRTWTPGRLVSAPDADADVEIRIRTGLTPDSKAYYTYTNYGDIEQVTKEEYFNLEEQTKPCGYVCRGRTSDRKYPGFQGPLTDDRKNWTGYSGAINKSGTVLSLPMGTHFQIRVDMTSNDFFDVARLDSLRIEILPLLVSTLVGEVAAVSAEAEDLALAPLGEPIELIYAIRAGFEGDKQGFDAIRIATPSTPEFVSLFMGPVGGELAPPVGPVSHEADETGLTVYLSEEDRVTDDRELRVNLRTTLYSLSERLEGSVFLSGNEEANQVQVIDDGNASDDIMTDQLQLVAEGNLPGAVTDLQLGTKTITPNGDGTNDVLQLSYTLFGLLDAEVEINVLDLAGQLVRRMMATGQNSGFNELPAAWNGTDEAGQLVAPGVYLLQVVSDTGRGRSAITRPIAVAY